MSEGRRERKVVSVLFAASTLEIARAGRVETEELVRATRLALRDAGDRAVSLNVFAAAAREYDRALELWPEDDQERPRLLLNAAEARVQAERWDPDELEKARDALLAAGDHSGVAEAKFSEPKCSGTSGEATRSPRAWSELPRWPPTCRARRPRRGSTRASSGCTGWRVGWTSPSRSRLRRSRWPTSSTSRKSGPTSSARAAPCELQGVTRKD